MKINKAKQNYKCLDCKTPIEIGEYYFAVQHDAWIGRYCSEECITNRANRLYEERYGTRVMSADELSLLDEEM